MLGSYKRAIDMHCIVVEIVCAFYGAIAYAGHIYIAYACIIDVCSFCISAYIAVDITTRTSVIYRIRFLAIYKLCYKKRNTFICSIIGACDGNNCIVLV